ncbi:ATP synthase mitochondrial F1 complex assembly factor 1 [Rhipicephalus sanguineus]|uniref:ATP synthase mitochondrial F1 complex assembly factor 1 n=1 Tax=Rhipicephalus sanguineus TaxID=34632 RepID=A0A9D4PJU1_RHISA|nr:ATP synthase mitochondrial F1 complex assembly factor 1 [Rhipicephalus sanguineus]KAH7943607.1 hypothetical protein HPB52_009467 [Rhipicephalus sanguineus]
MALFRPAWRFAFQRLVRNASNRNVGELQAIPARPLSSDSDTPSTYTSNPFYSKYADKIRELERRDPDALKRRRQQDEAASTSQKKTTNATDSEDSGVGNATVREEKSLQPEPTYVRPSKFDAEAIRELRSRCNSISELTEAWKQLHAGRDAVCAVIPSSTYETIRERAKDYPVFLYPLPRKAGGYEFVLSQFLGDQCHMTPLASYQRHGSEAPACLALSYLTQLASKDDLSVVLMSGEYDAKVIGPTEAQCLVNQLQLYYGGNELKKKLLLWNFNRESRSFNHEALIREFESSVTQEQEGSSVRQR